MYIDKKDPGTEPQTAFFSVRKMLFGVLCTKLISIPGTLSTGVA
jgi:hypothetical protein